MSMLSEYQAKVLATEVYQLDRSLNYTILGLTVKVGELAEWIDVSANGSIDLSDGTALSQIWRKNWKAELGDCWWYTVAIADAMDASLQDIRDQHSALRSNMDVDVQRMTPMSVYLSLVAENSRLAGWFRDSIGDKSETAATISNRSENMRRSLAIITHYLDALGSQQDMTRVEILDSNIKKLSNLS